METKRRQRAEILHSLQGPIQQRLGEKKYESSVQEIDTRLQIISQMPGRNVQQSQTVEAKGTVRHQDSQDTISI